MKHKNISIFIPHAGCPYQCAFCNQRAITAQENLPHADDVKQICQKALSEMRDITDAEIAFFGGSFTAVPEAYMLELLESAQEFVGENKFSGIRISTRPDCITPEILELLKQYHVTAIELGAQSMSDEVLESNQRGHIAEDVVKSSELIKKLGFESGLQIMFGLYQSTWDDEWHTMEEVIRIHPDTVRIYPVVVLKGTKLAELYQSGKYRLLPVQEVIRRVACEMEMFQKHEIQVIKVGLHASEFIEKDMIAGYYHPAFRELCENEIYRQHMIREISEHHRKTCVFAVNPRCISKAVGQKKSNLRYFAEHDKIAVKVIGDESLTLYQVKLLE